jgi:N utilization substance protein A
MVVSELRGEKIDIIPYNDEPARFVAKALSPARVREVLVDDVAKQATVVVPDDQLSLAIGREGQNARLAARLTGWRIDIRSETEFATEESEGEYEETESSGRCAAVLTSGRRCPNASLPGSRWCGLPAHQALEGSGSVYVGGEPPEGGEIGDDEPEPEVGGVAALAEGPAGTDADAEAPVEGDEESLTGESSLGDESGPGDGDDPLEPQADGAEPVGEAEDDVLDAEAVVADDALGSPEEETA